LIQAVCVNLSDLHHQRAPPKKRINMKYYTTTSGLLFLFLVLLLSCKGEEEDTPAPDNPDTGVTDYASNLHHPCILHTQADFDFVKQKLTTGAQPWANAFAHFAANKHAQSNWKATPVKKLARLDAGNWAGIGRWTQEGIAADWYDGVHNNYTNLMYDAASAYALAVRWKLTGDLQYGTAAVDILNAWAKKCTSFIVNTKGALIDPNENLIQMQTPQLAAAAEILRDCAYWQEADFEMFKNWLVDVFYKHASGFLQAKSGCAMHYWLNWDLAQMNAILAIGILTGDNYKINEAIKYFKKGLGTGNIANAVPYMHKDPNSDEMLGQGNECGRDQGHAVLDVSQMGMFCLLAKSVGEDLWTYDNAKALALCEYIAKYNIGAAEQGGNAINFKYEVPFTHYTNCEYDHAAISSEGRGNIRPCWELVVRLAQDCGKTAVYAGEWVTLMRQNAARGYSDGGQGDYGNNSGGYDQLGWGTLMFAKQ
jgi:hypothetical protein